MSVKGTVKNGIVVLHPGAKFPDGTEVEVVCASLPDRAVAGEILKDSPEALTQWLNWFDSLSPVFTGEELKGL